MNDRRTINLEQGWEFVQKGITKLLEGLPEPLFCSEDYMMIYAYSASVLCFFGFFGACLLAELHDHIVVDFFDVICRTIYSMCTQKPPHDYSQQLYDKYGESFEEYINSVVRN